MPITHVAKTCNYIKRFNLKFKCLNDNHVSGTHVSKSVTCFKTWDKYMCCSKTLNMCPLFSVKLISLIFN